MKLETKILTVYVLFSALFIAWKLWPKHTQTGNRLPKTDIDQITVDPVRHTLTVITRKGVITETLPDRKSTFDIKTDGTVKTTAKQLGFEARPFIGLGLGQGLRVYLGADLGYFKRTNFGLGIGLPSFGKSNWSVNDLKPLASVSYNVWDNANINLGIDTSKQIHVFMTVRI